MTRVSIVTNFARTLCDGHGQIRTLGKAVLPPTTCKAKRLIQALHTGYDILREPFHLGLFIENGVLQDMVHAGIFEARDLVCNLLW